MTTRAARTIGFIPSRPRWIGVSLAVGFAAAGIMLLIGGAVSTAQAATTYTFFTLDNANAADDAEFFDPNFNQLLGINNADVIVGYDGDGSVMPNKGYVLVPKNHYANENFPGSVQTQVTGLNNDNLVAGTFTWTVGFWIDKSGNNFGFANAAGIYAAKAFPNTPVGAASPCMGVRTNQLLGVNDTPIAVGFYLDAQCNAHGYTYQFETNTYTLLVLPFKGVVSATAAGINNSGIICGFFTDSFGRTHGFFGPQGAFEQVDVPASIGTGTTFSGINNNGIIVGFATKNNASVGIVYDANTGKTTEVNDPNASSTAAFGVTGTTINGLNDNGSLVGFYSDGTKVHGFLAVPNNP
jgi:hypothetical protein